MELLYRIDNDYSVTNTGLIFSHRRKKYLKQWNRGKGYLAVQIKGKTYSVHRLVAKAFLKNPNNYTEVNHKDGNKHNNDISNLEWISHQENMKHAGKSGLMKRGEQHSNNKLNELQVRIIRKMSPDFTHKEISNVFGVDKSVVTRVINRITWKHVD